MSEDKIKRRRFLADLLFAGGVVSAAALLARATQGQSETVASPSPAQTPCLQNSQAPPPSPILDGDVAIPEPALGGKVAAPQPVRPQIKGDVAMPQPRPSQPRPSQP